MTANRSQTDSTSITKFLSLLKPYQERIENLIRQNLSLFGKEGKLREACQYALLNGGRRIRPFLVYIVADALGNSTDVSHAALAAEFIHTASLIADDLPCMDDEDERRNKPTVHKVYGEAVALLVSYALIAAANQCIADSVKALKPFQSKLPIEANAIGILALENGAHNSGVSGTAGGQFLDIFPPDLTLSTIREVIKKKTVSLFEASFVFGWLYGGGHPEKLPLVKDCASHFGMAFQIADDIDDREQDALNERAINVANVLGVTKALEWFSEELEAYLKSLDKLKLNTPGLILLGKSLEEKVNSIPLHQ